MRFKTIQIDINEQNLFFSSDSHFMHKNIIKYCNRPFESVDEMNKTLIERWNNVVGEKDIVIHAGDFCFGGKVQWVQLLRRLNGIKYIAAGNHDKSIPTSEFVEVRQRLDIRVIGDPEIASDGQRITIDHYPMISWYQSHRGAWQLFGHVHGGLSNKGLEESKLTPNQLDVGVDIHDFTPISYEEVKTIITKQNLKTV